MPLSPRAWCAIGRTGAPSERGLCSDWLHADAIRGEPKKEPRRCALTDPDNLKSAVAYLREIARSPDTARAWPPGNNSRLPHFGLRKRRARDHCHLCERGGGGRAAHSPVSGLDL